MSVYDAVVWRAFLECGVVQFLSLEYDARVGGAHCKTCPESEPLHPMWSTLLYKRVDVIAETADSIWCVEVKPLASMSALGQALAYTSMLRKQRAMEKPARPVVVCSRVDEDVAPVFIEFGVSVVVVASSASGVGARVVRVLGLPLFPAQ